MQYIYELFKNITDLLHLHTFFRFSFSKDDTHYKSLVNVDCGMCKNHLVSRFVWFILFRAFFYSLGPYIVDGICSCI